MAVLDKSTAAGVVIAGVAVVGVLWYVKRMAGDAAAALGDAAASAWQGIEDTANAAAASLAQGWDDSVNTAGGLAAAAAGTGVQGAGTANWQATTEPVSPIGYTPVMTNDGPVYPSFSSSPATAALPDTAIDYGIGGQSVLDSAQWLGNTFGSSSSTPAAPAGFDYGTGGW